jgi:predicted small lipoprotein YifL
VREQRGRRALCAGLLTAAAVVGGCGQRGPLSLPESAQPLQRIDPNAPSAEPGNGAAAAPGEAADEQKRENER